MTPATKQFVTHSVSSIGTLPVNHSSHKSVGTSMLDLVEKLFARHGIRSLRYDGSMDRHARECALSTFKKAGGPKVILN